MSQRAERVLIYLGPSLSLEEARVIVPHAIFRGPAKQSDLMSDTVEIRPDKILLTDGEFLQSLSVWHKEILFAMSRGVTVYGASSMGALRAADLWRQGMIGVGKIFEWYRSGITEDDSEVALLYSHDARLRYYQHTIPLVNLRATLEFYREMLAINLDLEQRLLESAREVYFAGRTELIVWRRWAAILNDEAARFLTGNIIDQKRLDAIELLNTYQQIEAPKTTVDESMLSRYFWAAYDRDRKITIQTPEGAVRVAQQHIDGYIALHATDYPQIFSDARNFHLASVLGERLGITVSEEEAEREWARFQMRHSISTPEHVDRWMHSNALTSNEMCILMIKMALVRKLQHWMASSFAPQETTKITLDYLKSHDAYQYWASECALQEAEIQKRGVDESLVMSVMRLPEQKLFDHSQHAGITVDGNVDEYITETGFSSRQELSVALDRLTALER